MKKQKNFLGQGGIKNWVRLLKQSGGYLEGQKTDFIE